MTVPGGAGQPTDTDNDGWFVDVNGNYRSDFADVVLYFNQMTWMRRTSRSGASTTTQTAGSTSLTWSGCSTASSFFPGGPTPRARRRKDKHYYLAR